MAIISIGDNHKPQLARLQHLAEYFTAERARLEAELRYVMTAGQRAHGELTMFLQQVYGIDAQHSAVQVDADAGIITTPDSAPEQPDAESTPEQPPQRRA